MGSDHGKGMTDLKISWIEYLKNGLAFTFAASFIILSESVFVTPEAEAF
jgi:hypothetical protein